MAFNNSKDTIFYNIFSFISEKTAKELSLTLLQITSMLELAEYSNSTYPSISGADTRPGSPTNPSLSKRQAAAIAIHSLCIDSKTIQIMIYVLPLIIEDNQDLLMKRGGVDTLIHLLTTVESHPKDPRESGTINNIYPSSFMASVCSALTSCAHSNGVADNFLKHRLILS